MTAIEQKSVSTAAWAQLILLGLIAGDLSLAVQTLILSAILVPLISLLLAPAMHRLATHLTTGGS